MEKVVYYKMSEEDHKEAINYINTIRSEIHSIIDDLHNTDISRREAGILNKLEYCSKKFWDLNSLLR